jgi:hypothetical protein
LPVYVFDIDGVITGPNTSELDDRVTDWMVEQLKHGTKIAVNSGRSYAWIEENLLLSLISKGAGTVFDNFLLVCEMGGETYSTYEGEMVLKPSRFALAPEAHAKAHDIFKRNKGGFATLKWDNTKHTMATISKHTAADPERFKSEREIMLDKVKDGLEGFEVKVMSDITATNIVSPLAGKHAGAALIYDWVLKDMPEGVSHPEQLTFISIGDSSSDMAMADYFAEKGAASTFVYVGDPKVKLEEHEGVNRVVTNARYADGTTEFLSAEVRV